MRWMTLALLGAIFVSGCSQTAPAPMSEPTQRYDKHTDQTITESKLVTINSKGSGELKAAAQHDTKTGFSLLLGYVSTGERWKFFSQAWSNGKPLSYTRGGSQVGSCRGGCTTSEIGFISLSETEFRQAAKSGFEFKLMGSGGEVEATAPSYLFQEVLDRL